MAYDPYEPRQPRKTKAQATTEELGKERTDALVNEAAKRLLSFIERIEEREEEIAAVRDDIKTLLAEGKGTGFEPKIIRKVIRVRKQDAAERLQEQETLRIYLDALGMA